LRVGKLGGIDVIVASIVALCAAVPISHA
jgi:hypothetical protein